MLMITATMRLLEMSDSQFPVGNFSFSNGLETASHEHIVHDAATPPHMYAPPQSRAYTPTA